MAVATRRPGKKIRASCVSVGGMVEERRVIWPPARLECLLFGHVLGRCPQAIWADVHFEPEDNSIWKFAAKPGWFLIPEKLFHFSLQLLF